MNYFFNFFNKWGNLIIVKYSITTNKNLPNQLLNKNHFDGFDSPETNQPTT